MGDLADGRGAPGLIGVVGAGTMGAGISQLALEAGHRVLLYDVDEAAIDRGRARIRDGLARRARRLDLDPPAAEAWIEDRVRRVAAASTLRDLAAGGPEVVIETALEDLVAKRTIFRTLDATTPPDTILATNTSALSVSEIAATSGRPERILGLHFFNPAPVMPLVEVVITSAADPVIADRAIELMTTWGKVPVRCADTPGFIVNRVNRPFTLEALAILAGGEASVQVIDDAVRADGLPMGPFELMDLVGLDINLAAARGVFARFVAAGDPLAERFRPSPIQKDLVAAGQLGRKTNKGFYAYDEGGALVGPAPAFAAGDDRPDQASHADIARRIMLAVINEAYRAAGDGIASRSDIDLAMRLGAGHPVGPFEQVAGQGGPNAIRDELRAYAAAGPRFDPARALLFGA
jgi:3-hydroxybutyryl-CoA dehydrogenase